MFSLGSVPTAFAFDPKYARDALRGARGALCASEDAGPQLAAWCCPDPAQNTVEHGSVAITRDRVFTTDDPPTRAAAAA